MRHRHRRSADVALRVLRIRRCKRAQGLRTPARSPSANASGLISPTRASHVLASLNGRILLVIDGGATQHGIESTIVAATGGPLRLLRRGPIHVDAVEARGSTIEAPGQLASHYAPKKPLRLDVAEAQDGEFLIGFGPVGGDVTLSKSGDPIEAGQLFDLLHQPTRRHRRASPSHHTGTASPPPLRRMSVRGATKENP